MSFDMFDVISDATTEADAFENHAAKELSLEQRMLYLQGLALVMNADNDVHDEEKEYLRILIKSFDMDESVLGACVQFSQAPDKDTIQAFFKTFRRRSIAQLFLFDAFVVSRRDDQTHDKETAVIHKMSEKLEILTGTQTDIYHLFCYIENRQWQESAVYFDSFLLNTDHFKHLLTYYEVDYDELMAATLEMRQKRLFEILKGKKPLEIEWESLKYCNDNCFPNASSISSHTIDFKSLLINADIIVPYLQARLNRGELRIYQQQVSFSTAAKEGEQVFFDLEGTGLQYDTENEELSLADKGNFTVPDEVLASLLLFIEPKLNDKSKNINLILTGLFNAKMARAKKYSKDDSDICFPLCEDSYIDEILLHYHNKNFIINEKTNYTSSVNGYEATPIEVLLSGNFRLMK